MSFERHKGIVPPRPVVDLSGGPEILGSQKECGICACSFLSLKNVSQALGFSVLWQLPILCKLKEQGD
jgi:hypothetical protein